MSKGPYVVWPWFLSCLLLCSPWLHSYCRVARSMNIPNLLLPWGLDTCWFLSWNALPLAILLTCSVTSTSFRPLLNNCLLCRALYITIYKTALPVSLILCFIYLIALVHCVMYFSVLMLSSFHKSINSRRVRP